MNLLDIKQAREKLKEIERCEVNAVPYVKVIPNRKASVEKCVITR